MCDDCILEEIKKLNNSERKRYERISSVLKDIQSEITVLKEIILKRPFLAPVPAPPGGTEPWDSPPKKKKNILEEIKQMDDKNKKRFQRLGENLTTALFANKKELIEIKQNIQQKYGGGRGCWRFRARARSCCGRRR